MSASLANRTCETAGCGSKANLQCPTCIKLDIPGSYFCSQVILLMIIFPYFGTCSHHLLLLRPMCMSSASYWMAISGRCTICFIFCLACIVLNIQLSLGVINTWFFEQVRLLAWRSVVKTSEFLRQGCMGRACTFFNLVLLVQTLFQLRRRIKQFVLHFSDTDMMLVIYSIQQKKTVIN